MSTNSLIFLICLSKSKGIMVYGFLNYLLYFEVTKKVFLAEMLKLDGGVFSSYIGTY